MPAWLDPVLNHLWQSTVFALAAAGLAAAFRRKPARVRYAIWLAASAKFLVPFGALAGLGTSMGWMLPPLVPPSRATLIASIAASPFSWPEYTAFPLPPAAIEVWGPDRIAMAVALLVWLGGTAVVLARWVLRWRALASLCRAGTPLHEGREPGILRSLEQRRGMNRPTLLVSTETAVEPGLFGVARPVLLWPRVMSAALDDAQIEAVFAHELSHASRRDNQTAALHMVTEVLFWFHPATWWIGSRLLQERERACDEDVLLRGSEPGVYAESILKTCTLCLTTPLACASGVSGADLRSRIERIMSASRTHALGRAGALALATLAVAVVAVPVAAGGLMLGTLGYGGSPYLQAPSQTMAFAPRAFVDPAVAETSRFAVASVRPAAHVRTWGDIRPWSGGRFTATAVTLRDLIRFAYSADSPLIDQELVDAPSWAATARFDIVARADREFANDQHGRPSELTAMVRNLLADRFQLQIRTETRQMPVFHLVRADAGGLRLRSTASTCWRPALGEPPGSRPIFPTCRTLLGRGRLVAEAVPMSWLANTLGAVVHQVVHDATGLRDRYDVDLEWSSGSGASGVGESLRTALGLALVGTEGPVDVLVIRDARHPAAD